MIVKRIAQSIKNRGVRKTIIHAFGMDKRQEEIESGN